MNEIRLADPILTKEMKDAALRALNDEKLVLGESVSRFEDALARYLGVDYVISVSSGTHALQFALMAAGVASGARVLTVSNSFIASANAALHAGGTPVFCDVDPLTYTMDPEKVSFASVEPPSVVMPVHLYGYPCDLPRILERAASVGASVIEDAAQAHGATLDGRKVGSWGLAGCFSFYPTKNLTVAGDGGAVSTNDERVANLIRKLRDCGRTTRYEHDLVGYTARLNTVNAAIGFEQLKHLDGWNEKRRELARGYEMELRDIPDVGLPPSATARVRPVYHLFVIRVPERDRVRERLAAAGIEAGVHYPVPIHLQPIYRSMFGYGGGEFPFTERLAREVLSLPCHPRLTKKDVRYICRLIRAFYQGG